MKIGIVTFWWSDDNYGQLLQCYALQRWLGKCGHESFVIRYRIHGPRQLSLWGKVWRLATHPRRAPEVVRCAIEIVQRHMVRHVGEMPDRGFNAFRDHCLEMSVREYADLDDLRRYPPDADAYVVGSDQVWNFGEALSIDDVRTMLLDFGNRETRRIAYAVSFGGVKIPEDRRAIVSDLLARFTHISVREKFGVEQCGQNGRSDVGVVCDPTMLVPRSEYDALSNMESVRNEKYVLCYILTNRCDFDLLAVKCWAENRGLSVVWVRGNGGEMALRGRRAVEWTYPTIPQWLGLLSTAEYVITNSYHCCVLSAHYNKRVGAVLLSGGNAGMNTRLAALDQYLETPLCKISSNDIEKIERSKPLRFVKDVNATGRLFLSAALGNC